MHENTYLCIFLSHLLWYYSTNHGTYKNLYVVHDRPRKTGKNEFDDTTLKFVKLPMTQIVYNEYKSLTTNCPMLTKNLKKSDQKFGKFLELALRSPTATGSPFGRSLAPWFGPSFEILRFFNFEDFRFFDFFRLSVF